MRHLAVVLTQWYSQARQLAIPYPFFSTLL